MILKTGLSGSIFDNSRSQNCFNVVVISYFIVLIKVFSQPDVWFFMGTRVLFYINFRFSTQSLGYLSAETFKLFIQQNFLSLIKMSQLYAKFQKIYLVSVTAENVQNTKKKSCYSKHMFRELIAQICSDLINRSTLYYMFLMIEMFQQYHEINCILNFINSTNLFLACLITQWETLD